MNWAALTLALAASADARVVELPAGTQLTVRLGRAVSAHASTPGDPVKAALVAPVRLDGEAILPVGWSVLGRVVETGSTRGRNRRARLLIAFRQLVDDNGESFPLEARVVEVIDAREGVDAEGRVLGLPALKGLPEQALERLRLAADLDPVALGLLEKGRGQMRASVWFDPGVDLRLELTRAASVTLAARSTDASAPAPAPLELRRAVLALPAAAEAAPGSGEPVNVLIAATAAQIDAALEAAGWWREGAGRLDVAWKAFTSLAASQGYEPGAAARLQVAGRPADRAYEKRVNTLAKGRHLRLWRRQARYDGLPLWAGAVAREVRLELRSDGTYLSHLDPEVDAARRGLVDDLVFAGKLLAAGVVERAKPASLRSAAGDPLDTDGAVAVLVLAPAPTPPPTPSPSPSAVPAPVR